MSYYVELDMLVLCRHHKNLINFVTQIGIGTCVKLSSHST